MTEASQTAGWSKIAALTKVLCKTVAWHLEGWNENRPVATKIANIKRLIFIPWSLWENDTYIAVGKQGLGACRVHDINLGRFS